MTDPPRLSCYETQFPQGGLPSKAALLFANEAESHRPLQLDCGGGMWLAVADSQKSNCPARHDGMERETQGSAKVFDETPSR